MWQGLIWLACLVLIVVGLNQLNEQQAQTLNQTKEKLTQITHQVHQKRIQVQQLQHDLKEMNEHDRNWIQNMCIACLIY